MKKSIVALLVIEGLAIAASICIILLTLTGKRNFEVHLSTPMAVVFFVMAICGLMGAWKTATRYRKTAQGKYLQKQ
jgi:hypothetical protein